MTSSPSYPTVAAISKAAAVGSGKTDELDRRTGTRELTPSSVDPSASHAVPTTGVNTVIPGGAAVQVTCTRTLSRVSRRDQIRSARAAAAAARADEVDLDFPREWIEFLDPDDEQHLVRADLTWLLSRWTCVFGSACHGIVAGRAQEGCCTHGAFFTAADDENRVKAAAARLTPQTWQHYRRGFKNYTEMDTIDGSKPSRRTAIRTEDGPCVFLNDPDFVGGGGCALHAQALRA